MDTENKISLMVGWQFHLGDLPRRKKTEQLMHKNGGALREVDFSAGDWQDITLPHDWMSFLLPTEDGDDGTGCKPRGIGWYRKTFSLPTEPIEWAELTFDGVMGECQVYVNGVLTVRNFSGYNRFSAEIEDDLVPGTENEIVVFVDAGRGEAWSYEGAGIYRNVYLRLGKNRHISRENCFIRAEKAGETWHIAADLSATTDNGIWKVRLDAPDGTRLFETKYATGNLTSFQLPVETPVLWSPETPNLYRLTAELWEIEKVLDEIIFDVGLRTVEWIPEKGMFLNGIHYPVKGICCHQDHAGVGAALTEEIWAYRISKLKSMGANAYRCAHNAPDETLLRVCDRLGILVMVENRHFDTTAETVKQLESMVKTARNHPCVFLYSLFNEEPLQAELQGKHIAEKLRDRVRALDATRAVMGAQNTGLTAQNNASQCLDIAGFNYSMDDYEKVHRLMPDKVILGTENCPTFSTRGEMADDKTRQVFADTAEAWASRFAESMTKTMRIAFSREYVAGCFVWAGFDSRGESNPYQWPSVLCHWGAMDYCGFEKATAYLLAAWYREDPVLHLCVRWENERRQTLSVHVLTNCETAELYVNGVSVGRKNAEDRRAVWNDIPTGAVLRAEGEKQGQKVIDQRIPAGNATAIRVEEVTDPSATVRILQIIALDAAGIPADSDASVLLSVTDGRILGLGNGDPNGHQPEKGSTVPLFHGKAQVILKGATARLTASFAASAK